MPVGCYHVFQTRSHSTKVTLLCWKARLFTWKRRAILCAKLCTMHLGHQILILQLFSPRCELWDAKESSANIIYRMQQPQNQASIRFQAVMLLSRNVDKVALSFYFSFLLQPKRESLALLFLLLFPKILILPFYFHKLLCCAEPWS